MAKEKKAEKAKKPSDSEGKTNEPGIKSLLKNLAEKVAEVEMSAGSDKSTDKPADKPAAKSAAKKAPKATPSALTSAGSAPAVEMPVAKIKVTPVIPAVVVAADDLEVILTDAEGRRYCRATDCDQIGMVDGYCRYHYLYFWKKIQNRKKILADGKLERYIEELTSRYTDKFIELLRKDTRTEKDFLGAVQELELDDSASASAADEDEAKTYLEEISGVATDSGSRDEESY